MEPSNKSCGAPARDGHDMIYHGSAQICGSFPKNDAPKYWLVNRDPYLMVYEIIPI